MCAFHQVVFLACFLTKLHSYTYEMQNGAKYFTAITVNTLDGYEVDIHIVDLVLDCYIYILLTFVSSGHYDEDIVGPVCHISY